jgi:hypothetical protein
MRDRSSLSATNPATASQAIRHLEIAADKIPAAARNLAKARQLTAASSRSHRRESAFLGG